MPGLPRDLASELEERYRWAAIEGAYQRLRRDDPSGWAAYLAEVSAWDAAASDPGDAAAEWPEYNSLRSNRAASGG
jgi:hypothetical protein